MRTASSKASDTFVSIRKAKASDVPELIKISQSRAKAPMEKGGMPWKGVSKYLKLKKWLGGVLKSQKKKETVFLVAEADRKAIGSCMIRKSPWKWKSHIGMLEIDIAPRYQGMGIGQLLMKDSIISAKREWKGLETVALEVVGSNKQAIRAYEKFGFKRVAEVPNVTKWKGKYHSMVTIHLRVR